MDTGDCTAGDATTAGSLTTVYAEAAADSGDVIELRPGGDVRLWHNGDVTQRPEEDRDSSLAAKSDVTFTRERFDYESELENSSVVCDPTRGVTNHSREAACPLSGSGASAECHSNVSSEPHHGASAGQPADDATHRTASNLAAKSSDAVLPNVGSADTVEYVVAAVATMDTAAVTPVDTANTAANPVDSANTAVTPVDTVTEAITAVKSANTAVTAASPAADDSVDEVDAVHPRFTGAARRRRVSHPAFACDTCCRDTTGWRDCVDHAYRSGHGLAARCALCRLPAVRCRRRGRTGVWHRCAVVETVRKLGAGNVAALMAGSHLTAPRPWRLSCGECGAAFAAKTARLVQHVVERGHAVRRHCERCLFPVFEFGLNDERREVHVCVGSAAWLRSEEGALLVTAAEHAPPHGSHLNGAAGDESGDRWGRNGGPSHHQPHSTGPTHAALGHHLANGDATRPGEDIASDYHHRHHQRVLQAGNGRASALSRGHRAGDTGGTGGLGMSSHGEGVGVAGGSGGSGGVPGVGGRLVSLASEERPSSCVAI